MCKPEISALLHTGPRSLHPAPKEQPHGGRRGGDPRRDRSQSPDAFDRTPAIRSATAAHFGVTGGSCAALHWGDDAAAKKRRMRCSFATPVSGEW
ncbi:hypothetical protein MTO96_027451 [Rhipicephalus appendiculatus]